MNNPVSPKVSAAAIGAAVASLIVWILTANGVEVPPEAQAAFVVLLTFAAGYVVKDPLRQAAIEEGTGKHRAEEGA